MTKAELLNKINELEISDDVKIELMENVADLEDIEKMDDTERTDLLAKIEDLEMKAEELKEKYKARFLSSEEVPEDKRDDEELKEEEVVDIKEI